MSQLLLSSMDFMFLQYQTPVCHSLYFSIICIHKLVAFIFYSAVSCACNVAVSALTAFLVISIPRWLIKPVKCLSVRPCICPRQSYELWDKTCRKWNFEFWPLRRTESPQTTHPDRDAYIVRWHVKCTAMHSVNKIQNTIKKILYKIH